ncbi:MAG: 50S ribosomal protein L44e [Candidatus Woesearchaeota archaeon]|nr:50S ribosomal protein L44e [Candidatus Woesearchaeota archaeon]
MKLPKTTKRYCPYCKKHTEHAIIFGKKRSPSSMSYGSKYRARKRGQARGHGNLGRYSKPAVTKFKMTGKKQTKKTDLRYECKVCKKQHVQKKGIRAKKVEFKQ